MPSQRLSLFCWLLLFWNLFSQKNNSTVRSIISTTIAVHPHPPSPNSIMILPVVTIIKEMKEKKQRKEKIGLGYIVTVKVGDMDEDIRQGRSRIMMRGVIECVQATLVKNNILVQFENRQNIDLICCSLSCLCSKYEVGQEVN